MGIILSVVNSIEILLATIILFMAVHIVKRQDKLRKNHYLFRQRVKVLRDFRRLYDNFSSCMTATKKTKSFMDKNKIQEIVLNDCFDYESMGQEQQNNEINLRQKLNRLDALSADFHILYDKEEIRLIENFIFWYHLLLIEVWHNKIRLNDSRDFNLITQHFEGELKNLEQSYRSIKDSQIISKLEKETQLTM